MGFFSFLQPVEKAAGNVFHFLGNTATGIKNDVTSAVDFANAGAQGVAGLSSIAAAKLTHNPVAENNAINRTQAAQSYSLAAQKNPVATKQQLSSNDFKMSFLQPLAKGVATYAPFAVGGVGAGVAGEGASLAARTGASAAVNAGVGAGSSALEQVATTGHVNPTDVLKNAAVGAAFGAAGELAPAAVGAAKDVVKNAPPLNEIGAVGKNVNTAITSGIISNLVHADTAKEVQSILNGKLNTATIQKVAPAIVEAKDPHIITNIIGQATESPKVALPPSVPEPATPVVQSTEIAPVDTTQAPVINPAMQERGFTTSVKEASNYSPELKQTVNSQYQTATDAATVAKTQQFLKQPIEQAHSQVLDRLQSTTAPDKQLISDAGTVMQHLDAQGKTAEAATVHDLIAQKLTQSGQTSQAAALLLKRSPEGLYYSARKALDKGNVEITSKVDEQLQNFKENIRTTTPDSAERQQAVQEMQSFVDKQIPSSATDKVFSIWRAGLLTGPQTVAKIITSHAVNSALETAKDVPAAAVDKFLSLFTGQRSLVATTKGLGRGAKQGAEAGKTLMTKGIDINPGTNASELHQSVNFGSSIPGKIAQAYVDTVGHIHGSLYKPFYGAAHLQSLYSQGLAAAKNAGVTGAEKESFLENFVKNPTPEAMDVAKKDAEHATFQQETALGNVASAIQKKGGIVGKVIAPFTRIPSAIATDLINYSPVGLAKTIIDGIKTAKSDTGWTLQAQRQFSQGIGRGLVGSAAIIPGMMLMNRGILTLEYPTDPKEQKLWALEGKQPNSVLIGGQWRSLGSIGPAGSVLAIGGHIADSLMKGSDLGTALINGLSGGLRSIESESYLEGVSGAINAINDPGRYATNFIKQTVGSVVPTALNTAAVATDKYTRQTSSPLDAIKSRIPGVRESLPAKVNTLGQPIPTGETGLERFLDPFQSSTSRLPNKVVDELQRLQDAGQGILPASIAKTTSFNGVKTTLTPDQVRQLTTSIGQDTLKRWTELISRPGYQHLSDVQKSKQLETAYSHIAATQKTSFARSQKIGRYAANYSANKKQSKTNKKFVAQS